MLANITFASSSICCDIMGTKLALQLDPGADQRISASDCWPCSYKSEAKTRLAA